VISFFASEWGRAFALSGNPTHSQKRRSLMGLIIQQRALEAAGGLRRLLPVVRKRDRSLFDQIHRAMNSVVLNIAEADGNDAGTAKARFATACGSAKEVRAGMRLAVAYGYVSSSRVNEVDIALDEVCAMSWRLSGR